MFFNLNMRQGSYLIFLERVCSFHCDISMFSVLAALVIVLCNVVIAIY